MKPAVVGTVLILFVCVNGTTMAKGATTAPLDSTDASSSHRGLVVRESPFDTLSRQDYLANHAFSFDNFLEFAPGVLLQRLGPIGTDAWYSRFGIGRGRGGVYLGHVPLNDPQDGRAPLVLLPTTSVGRVMFNETSPAGDVSLSSIEGVIHVAEPGRPVDQPRVALEFSKGTHELKQRRARFSSADGAIGVDVAYDELLNSGYAYDARGFLAGAGVGTAATRVQSADVRGTLPSGDDFQFSLRDFETTFDGDAESVYNEHRRDGFIATVEASVDHMDATAYERSYQVSTPDSATSNQTTGIALRFPFVEGTAARVGLAISYEDVIARQDIASSRSRDRVQDVSMSAFGGGAFAGGRSYSFQVQVAHQSPFASAVGASASLASPLGKRHLAIVEARRGYRLPSIGELRLPSHMTASGTTIVGNSGLRAETSLEGVVRVCSRLGAFENDIGLTGIRVADPVLPESNGSVTRPVNASAQHVAVVDERLRGRFLMAGLNVVVEASAQTASGKRSGYFDGVPPFRANASLSLERGLFQETSYLAFTAEYSHTGERTSIGGQALGAYDVVNLKLDARLVDAHMFLMYLNALDAQYETVSPYLMTPRTFVYGIAWTLYN